MIAYARCPRCGHLVSPWHHHWTKPGEVVVAKSDWIKGEV